MMHKAKYIITMIQMCIVAKYLNFIHPSMYCVKGNLTVESYFGIRL